MSHVTFVTGILLGANFIKLSSRKYCLNISLRSIKWVGHQSQQCRLYGVLADNLFLLSKIFCTEQVFCAYRLHDIGPCLIGERIPFSIDHKPVVISRGLLPCAMMTCEIFQTRVSESNRRCWDSLIFIWATITRWNYSILKLQSMLKLVFKKTIGGRWIDCWLKLHTFVPLLRSWLSIYATWTVRMSLQSVAMSPQYGVSWPWHRWRAVLWKKPLTRTSRPTTLQLTLRSLMHQLHPVRQNIAISFHLFWLCSQGL